ncbi:guanylate kinase [Phosphitispora sp. TUW77]|uniref:guanylate kinase n=1 Tax=Phosphitispora sp. TUW77 TaxID=3152361 RepID=UPI003AB1A9C9
MTVPGLLIVISGPSGTGKGSICRCLLKRRPDIFLSVSATTRLPRAGETNGKEYHFKDKTEFEAMLAQDEFLEWASVYDNYYGTPRTPVDSALAQGRDVLLEIDIKGALKVKQKAPEGIYIFLVPPSMEVLRTRITGRGTDSMEVISKRLGKSMEELSYLYEYNYVVVNDVLEEAAAKVESIIIAEKSRTHRYRIQSNAGPEEPLLVEKDLKNW